MKVKNSQASKVLETPKIKDAVVHEKSHPLAEKHSVQKKIINADMPQQQFSPKTYEINGAPDSSFKRIRRILMKMEAFL